jgi:protease IV
MSRHLFRRFWLIIAALAVLMFTMIIPARAASSPSTQSSSSKGVIPVFDLRGELTEQPADDQLPIFSSPGASLRDVVTRMKKAADDPNVKAVVILADDAEFGFGQAQEIGAAMRAVRAAGKDVYAHADSMMTGHYLLLSGATRLSVAPTGDLLINGLYGDGLYLKDLLTKIGVQADILHCGDYKSAGEIFMRDGPSPQAEEMMNWLFDSLFDSAIDQIAAGRKATPQQVRSWIDDGLYTAEKAKAAGLIDAVEARADFGAMLKEKFGKDTAFDRQYGQPKKPQLDFSNPFALMAGLAELMSGGQAQPSNKPAVGVVYVDGAILLGRKEEGLFSGNAAMSTDIAAALDKAADEDGVKAVVLRIDSPGGSATGSEVILQATQRLKSKKPLVVSMGNVAGSGGYYVACGADTIFADAGTITGSIGVVGGKLITTDMWHKIGVNWHAYARGKNADLLSTDTDFSPEQREKIQAWMNDIYGVFKGHVTAIRGNRLKKPIDDIAGGRVYTGKQALDLGLVDKIGTLQDAIAYVADEAKLKDYDVRTVPEPKNILQQLVEQSAGGENDPDRISTGSSADAARATNDALLKLVAPLLTQLDPQHVKLLRTAMDQLQLVQREGVILMMPAQFASGEVR